MRRNSPDNNQITILHLSDFHFNEESREEITTVLDALFDDLQKLGDEYCVSPNLVVISGDIANEGDQADYNFALDWLYNLLEKLKISPDNVFIVPGNHDIDRNELTEFSKLKFDDEDSVTKFLNKGGNERIATFKKLDNFYEFTKNFYGDKNPYGENYYLSTTMQVGENRISIVGLNTAWFSGERRFEDGAVILDGKALIVGENQVRKAYEFLGDVDLCFTVMHHPFSWLADFDEGIIKRIVMKNSNIIFHGHIHSSSTTESIEPDSRCITLSAGASYIKNRIKRYTLCKINLEDFSYDVYLRIFSDENKFWARDTLTYQTGEGIIHGRLVMAENGSEGKPLREYPFDEPDLHIEKFIRHSWKKLVLTEGYERDKIIELRHNFFHKYNLNPSLHDIALQTIQYLLENKLIRAQKELENIIHNSPFIDKHLIGFEKQNISAHFDDKYFETQKAGIVFTNKEEIAKLKERGFFVKKEREIAQKIEEKLKKEYEEKERKLKKREGEIEAEYEIFTSEIDDYPSLNEEDLPKFKTSIPVPRGKWYEELGLRKNPFPSHIALEGIDEVLYDNIIVKTDIFHNFDCEITNSAQSLKRRSFLVYGVMGSGKTTLFKYLQKTISIFVPNTSTILIPLEAQGEYEKIRHDFYQKLYEKLKMIYFSRTKSPTGIERSTINDSTISYLFQQIIQIANVDNFVIFIDDLHKHPEYVQEVFEFISGLQIFRSHMYEDGINVTIFLSGDIMWISDADGVKAIGGSIDTKEKIPEISINDAVEMINKRLKVFAKNPENPPTIKPENVETIFKILKARIPIEVTFRDIIEEVEKHWMNHEFESLKLHEILDFNTLSSMMLDIESDHPRMKAKIDSIWTYAGKDESIFNQFTEIIETVYLKRGLSEGSYEFESNREYYGYLYRVGLISKQRRNHSFVWFLTKEAWKMFKKFEGKYGFNRPSEYLSKLYPKDEIDRRYISEESSRMNMILKTGGIYGDPFLRYIKDALDNYKMIFKHTTSIQELYKPQELVDICKKSVACLMKATLIVCEKKSIKTESLYEVHEEFIDNWFRNSDLAEFVDTIQKKELKETQLSLNDVKEICRDYFRAIKTTISNLQRFMKYDTVFTLESKLIHTQNKKNLNDIRKKFYNDNYASALDKINSLIVSKLIEIIYTVNCLMYGSNKWKRGLPLKINEKLTGITGVDSNEKSILNNLNLIDLTSVCLKLDDITEKVFGALFDEEVWGASKRTLFLEKELQVVSSDSTINRRKGEILSYILQAKILVEKVDSFYYRLFLDKIPFIMNYRSFGISLKEEDKRLSAYEVKEDIVRKIASKIDTDGSIELDFSMYIPNSSFQDINFVDWIMYVYHMKFNLKTISINIALNGSVIIS